MGALPTHSDGDLEQRLRKLAAEKSLLQLIISLMNAITAPGGLEETVDALLRGIVDTIGGDNAHLYYAIDDSWYHADAHLDHAPFETAASPVVRSVIANRQALEVQGDFSATRMLTPEFHNAYTWYQPLLAGTDFIGVLEVENLHLSMRELGEPLATFFNYVALVLKNQIRSRERLQSANVQLSRANAELRQSHSELEDRVRTRTAELADANQALQIEIAGHREARAAIERESAIRAALADLYRPLAAPESTLADIGHCVLEQAKLLTGCPHGFVSEIDPLTGDNTAFTLTSMIDSGSLPPDQDLVVRFPRGPDGQYRGLLGQALNDRRAFFTNSPLSDPRGHGVPRGHFAITSLLCVPVLLGEDLVGEIALANKPGGFDDSDLTVARRIAAYYALALQRKRAEATIQHLAAVPQHAPVMICEFSRQLQLLFINPAMHDGLVRWQIGDPLQFVPAEWRARLATAGPLEALSGSLETRLAERVFDVRLSSLPTYQSLLVFAIDITERRQAEDEQARLRLYLEQSQKMEALGRMAGGVAHDFNNLLTVINGYTEMALLRLQQGDPLQHDLAEVQRAGLRATELTAQLLAFSRRQVAQPRVVDLNQELGEAERMLQRVIGEDVKLECVLDPDLHAVELDPGQLNQILMNLAANARDAMPDGGRLLLETRNQTVVREWATHHSTLPPGQYVVLSVSDSGIGMDAETRARIFEPFFTTKELGRGTGMGLATVFGIVKQAGGSISVYSEPGRGTTFNLYFPRCTGSAASQPDAAPPVHPLAGNETLLVVEDQPQVRELTCATLRNLGYHVLEAGDGIEALESSAAFEGDIQLVVTDIVMPRLGGQDLAARLRALRPAARLLYVSGYSGSLRRATSPLEPGADYLQKPFSTEALARKVREILDRPRAAG